MHSIDFRKIIETLCKEGKILRYYRPELELIIETDASGKGIGMALLQSENDERSSLYPIAFGSKTLTSVETRYANIESFWAWLECLKCFIILPLEGQWSF